MRLTAPAPAFPSARRPPAPHFPVVPPGDQAFAYEGSELFSRVQ